MKRHRDGAERVNAGAIAIGCFLLLLLASDGDSQTIMFAGGGSSGGTVQSVAATVPAYMIVSGSPITTTGTLVFAFGSQSQGIVFASPCSGAGVPVFRSLCAADIPTLAQSQVSGLTSSLAAKESTANRNVANGYAGLDAGGKILSTQLPSIAITDTFVVASQAAMLALTAETGDVAIRTDVSQTYILRGTDSTLLTDWSLLATPADNVTSVAGRTGAVTLSVTDVSGAEATANKNTTNGYAGLSAGKVAGTQITYGSTASTATEGNDSRLSNARTPTAHASTHASAGSDPVTLVESQITGLVSDLSGKQATGNYITALTGDGTATGPGSVAFTLAAIGAGAGSCSLCSVTVDAKGRVTAYSSGTAGANAALSNLAAVAINQPLTTTAGTVAALSTTAAVATASTAAGVGLTITADPAVAGTTNAGAANGGNVTISSGSAARLTSGNANGGDIKLQATGAGVGTGRGGVVQISGAPQGCCSTPLLNLDQANPTGFYASNGTAQLTAIVNSSAALDIKNGGPFIQQVGCYFWANGASAASGGNWDSRICRTSQGGLTLEGSSNGAAVAAGALTITAGANGSSYTQGSTSELLTLSTSGTTTATVGNLVPANAQIKSIVYRITTTIATATAFTVSVTGGNVFSNIGTATTSQGTLSLGTTGRLVPSAFADQYNVSATTLTVTTTGTPSAGAIRLTVIYETYSAPTS